MFRTKIGEAQYQAIEQWVLDHFDRQEWVNTTFIAPRAWQGTPLLPIWNYFAAIADEDERHQQSAMLYGCVVYTILFEQPGTYIFHRPEGHHSDDRRPFGLTYRRA